MFFDVKGFVINLLPLQNQDPPEVFQKAVNGLEACRLAVLLLVLVGLMGDGRVRDIHRSSFFIPAARNGMFSPVIKLVISSDLRKVCKTL